MKARLKINTMVEVSDDEIADLLLQRACQLLEGEGVIIFSRRIHLTASNSNRVLFEGEFISDKTYPFEAQLIRVAWALLERGQI